MPDTTVNFMHRSWDYILNGPEKTDAPTEKEHQKFIRERNTGFTKRATPAQTFSLASAVIFGLGWLFCLKGDNNSATWTTGLLAGVGAVATAVFSLCFGWSLKGSYDEQYNNKIFEMASKEIAKNIGGDATAIKNALAEPNAQNAEVIKNITSIEYTATKKDSSKVNITIRVHYNNPTTNKNEIINIPYEETWDGLPSQVRSDFLTKGGDIHKYTVYNKKDSVKATANDEVTKPCKPISEIDIAEEITYNNASETMLSEVLSGKRHINTLCLGGFYEDFKWTCNEHGIVIGEDGLTRKETKGGQASPLSPSDTYEALSKLSKHRIAAIRFHGVVYLLTHAKKYYPERSNEISEFLSKRIKENDLAIKAALSGFEGFPFKNEEDKDFASKIVESANK